MVISYGTENRFKKTKRKLNEKIQVRILNTYSDQTNIEWGIPPNVFEIV